MTSSSDNNKGQRYSLSAKEQVMLQFHRTTLEMTRNFLETQKQVMLAYLAGNGAASYDIELKLNDHEESYPVIPPSAAAYPDSAPVKAGFVENEIRAIAAQTRSVNVFQELAPVNNGKNGNGHNRTAPVPPAPAAGNTEVLSTASPDMEKPSGKGTETPTGTELKSEALVSALIEIVSERTGYPADMLDPSLDLESDLGIDSIKRVEILNTFRKLLPDERQQALEGSIEQLAGIKTLDGIFNWIRTELTAPASHAQNAPTTTGDTTTEAVTTAAGARLEGAIVTSASSEAATFTLTMGPREDLYLKDHTFDGIPVMPMAIAVELMAEAAASLYPDWTVTGLRNLEIPAGIVFEAQTKDICIEVSTAEHSAGSLCLSAKVNSKGAIPRTHFKCIVDMAPRALPPSDLPMELPAVFAEQTFKDALTALPGPQEIYSTMMFHGETFQGIKAVTAIGINGVTGKVSATDPARLLARPPARRWIIDPIVLDSAMQLAGVWARKFLDITVLPAGVDALTLFAPMTDEDYKVIVAIPPETRGLSLKCNLAVYSSKGRIVLLLEGLKGIGSKSLNRLSSQQV